MNLCFPIQTKQSLDSQMATETEKARVIELRVRMDCTGCVRRIKKALNIIEGVSDVYVDVPEQKITVVGRADPETLVKAIKKTKKTATICSHTEPAAPEPAEPPPTDAPPAEEAPPSPQEPEEPKDVEEVHHMVHHYPHNYVYREHTNSYPPMEELQEHEVRHHAVPYYATHSYNSTHRPSTYVSESVSVYGYNRSPPSDKYRNHGDGNQLLSMFSDENPNACTIT